MHEEQHAELLRLGPERIELAIGEFLPFDASADGGATQPKFLHGQFELLGGKLGVLQRERRHANESIRMLRAPL